MLKVFEITHRKEIEYITSPNELKAKIKFSDYKGWTYEQYGANFCKCREITGEELTSTVIDENHNYDGCTNSLTLMAIAERETEYDPTETECVGFKNI